MADVVVSEAAADDIIMRIVVVGAVVGSNGADFSLFDFKFSTSCPHFIHPFVCFLKIAH